MKIAILGAGAFGTALGGILASNGYDIDYYDSRVEKERLGDVIQGAKYVVLCVPSKAVPYVLPHLPKDKPLIVATKGILTDETFVPFKDYMVLSGPGFADDIKAHKKTYLTLTDKRLAEMFRAEYMEFDFTSDRKGVLMCGALKNVYACLAGLWGLERNTGPWRAFVDEVLEEMRDLLVANGAKAATVNCACGRGDLELTAGMPSRNYEFGLQIRNGKGYHSEKTVEGLSALKRICRGEIVVLSSAKKLNFIMGESKKWD